MDENGWMGMDGWNCKIIHGWMDKKWMDGFKKHFNPSIHFYPSIHAFVFFVSKKIETLQFLKISQIILKKRISKTELEPQYSVFSKIVFSFPTASTNCKHKHPKNFLHETMCCFAWRTLQRELPDKAQNLKTIQNKELPLQDAFNYWRRYLLSDKHILTTEDTAMYRKQNYFQFEGNIFSILLIPRNYENCFVCGQSPHKFASEDTSQVKNCDITS